LQCTALQALIPRKGLHPPLPVVTASFPAGLFGLAHPESLRSAIRGWVTKAWAARHAPGWLAEEQSKVEATRCRDADVPYGLRVR
jgi:hypothetical protein